MAIPNKERLSWLIIEDSLKDFHGHFLDFVTTFVRGLTALGDQVTVLCSRGATDVVIEQTGAIPVMPDACWRTGSLRNPLNILKSIYWIGASLIVLLRNNRLIDQSDLIFLTAVRLQHLILWRIYFALRGQRFQTPLLLLFMVTPVRKNASGSGYEWQGLLGRAFGGLLKSLGSEPGAKRIRFATETEQLSGCLSVLSGVPFETLPQPVEADEARLAVSSAKNDSLITIGSFGPPREEKGSHLLIKAIAIVLSNKESQMARFVVQWTQDFRCEDGSLAEIPPEVQSSAHFRVIPHYFAPGEYEKILGEIDAIILPYGSEYSLRGSRVVIDALVRGLPVAVTAGSSLQTLAQRYGNCVLIESWDAPAVAKAVIDLVRLVQGTSQSECFVARKAREYFSVCEFRRRWLTGEP
jgi:glycosyltransferase involved in cell wall biosynthesis